MKKILNGIFMVLKFILLILGFGLSFFIILSMYKRIDKNKFKDKRISDYVKHYDVIFKSYESKRKYIGYFK